MRFTKIPETTFQTIQLNAGMIVKDFKPDQKTIGEIVGATSGGVTFAATPTYSDWGSDIDNCPKNMKELKKLDSWDVKMSGTFATIDDDQAKSLIGAADISGIKITPRNDVLDTDFSDIWWVGDYSDKNGEQNGGFVAIHMMDVLSTAGFQLKSNDKGKGQFPFEYTAHYSNADPDKVPFEVYVQAGEEEPAA